MMSSELSRRVARLNEVPPILDWAQEEFNAFIDALNAAEIFDNLPEKYQQNILQGEGELQRSHSRGR